MQVMEIRRLMSFGQRENVSMSAKVDEGEDPNRALQDLEAVMREGIARYEEATVHRCRICGCTEEHGCEFGCYWVERDLCSECALNDKFVDEGALSWADKVLDCVIGGVQPNQREQLVDLLAAAIRDAYRKGRRAGE